MWRRSPADWEPRTDDSCEQGLLQMCWWHTELRTDEAFLSAPLPLHAALGLLFKAENLSFELMDRSAYNHSVTWRKPGSRF